MAKIYTRTGDQGETSILGGVRLPKSHVRFHAYGTIDELNAHLGLLISLLEKKSNTINAANLCLLRIQKELFVAGSWLACDDGEAFKRLPVLDVASITQMEKEIDHWTAQLKPLTNFILPGGSTEASQCHVARTVCRRAERHVSEVLAVAPLEFQPAYTLVLQYLNRLSDHLFTLSRWLNHQDQVPDSPWIPS